MNKIGGVFCDFFTKQLLYDFKKLPNNIKLEFYIEKTVLDNVICSSGRKIQDSRLNQKKSEEIQECKENKKYVVWVFSSNKKVEGSVKEFLTILADELKKRISDLLFLEVVEERIKKENKEDKHKNEKIKKDKLVQHFVGELIDKEWVVRNYIKNILEKEELPSLELLITLSAQKYEQRAVKTKLYFYKYPLNEDLFKESIMFVEKDSKEWLKLHTDNLRSVRKIMEMSGNNGLIVYKKDDIYYILGIAPSEGNSYLSSTQIEFFGHLSWKLIVNNVTLFEYNNGINKIPEIEGNDSAWIDELNGIKKVFPIFKTYGEYDKIVEDIVIKLKEQKHGTSIVFMDNNTLKEEIKRLTELNRAYQMIPFSILKHENAILGISAIDGAILADIEGYCHATGAILDGEATVRGNTARGARYNSLVNYITWVYKKYSKAETEDKEAIWCFAIIISEDRIVNLKIPKLFKQEHIS